MNIKEKILMFGTFLALAVGFALVTTTLFINGTVNISKNEDNFKTSFVFDSTSLRTSDSGAVLQISDSGKTLTFETNDLEAIGDESIGYFKIKNDSQYDGKLNTPAFNCYIVSNYEEDKETTKEADNNEYISIIPNTNLDGKTILSGTTSDESSITIRQIKSYSGETKKQVKFQCIIVANSTN